MSSFRFAGTFKCYSKGASPLRQTRCWWLAHPLTFQSNLAFHLMRGKVVHWVSNVIKCRTNKENTFFLGLERVSNLYWKTWQAQTRPSHLPLVGGADVQVTQDCLHPHFVVHSLIGGAIVCWSKRQKSSSYHLLDNYY